jgi:hypothetical protein
VQFIFHWLAVHTGTVNEAGPYYGFWSGFGSDLSEILGPIIALGLYYWHHQCHAKGCHRIGRHEAAGGQYKLCRRCHPDIPTRVSLASIHAAHAEHKARLNNPT